MFQRRISFVRSMIVLLPLFCIPNATLSYTDMWNPMLMPFGNNGAGVVYPQNNGGLYPNQQGAVSQGEAGFAPQGPGADQEQTAESKPNPFDQVAVDPNMMKPKNDGDEPPQNSNDETSNKSQEKTTSSANTQNQTGASTQPASSANNQVPSAAGQSVTAPSHFASPQAGNQAIPQNVYAAQQPGTETYPQLTPVPFKTFGPTGIETVPQPVPNEIYFNTPAQPAPGRTSDEQTTATITDATLQKVQQVNQEVFKLPISDQGYIVVSKDTNNAYLFPKGFYYIVYKVPVDAFDQKGPGLTDSNPFAPSGYVQTPIAFPLSN